MKKDLAICGNLRNSAGTCGNLRPVSHNIEKSCNNLGESFEINNKNPTPIVPVKNFNRIKSTGCQSKVPTTKSHKESAETGQIVNRNRVSHQFNLTESVEMDPVIDDVESLRRCPQNSGDSLRNLPVSEVGRRWNET